MKKEYTISNSKFVFSKNELGYQESYPINQNEKDMMRWIEDRKNYERQIKENIDYDIILEQYDKKWLDEIVMLMVDIVCCNEPYGKVMMHKKTSKKSS